MIKTIADAFARHSAIVAKSARDILPETERSAQILLSAIKQGNKLLVCGNGGSAADSQHLTGEFLCRYKADRRPLPAIALTADTSALTAIGNDYDFDQVFARQIKALGTAGDVLVVLTTSGQSPNILCAIKQAKAQGLRAIALTGARGSGLKEITDSAIAVPSDETARIQEVHELIYHAWCEFLDANLE